MTEKPENLGKLFRPSMRFRMHQIFHLPQRLICWRKGHIWHKWACARCFTIDEMRLAMFHLGNLHRRPWWWWDRRIEQQKQKKAAKASKEQR